MNRLLLVFAVVLGCSACSSSHENCARCVDGGRADADLVRPDANRTDAIVGCLPRAPSVHRPAATECDRVRPPGGSPGRLDPPSSCTTDAQCTAGANGRCNGNGRDGWRCTYDECFADRDCGAGRLCECEGAFRSDANICTRGNCVTDADCGPSGYCSPTLGSCGDYAGVVGWYCHTCEDECVDDADCGGGPPGTIAPYCAFDPALGHWACSSSQCAG